MNEDRKRNLRTQGRFSNEKPFYEKSKEKGKHSGSKSDHKGRKEENVYSESSSSDRNKVMRSDFSQRDLETKLSVQYQEHSSYTFPELSSKKNVVKLKISGFYVLSETENGKSSVYYDPGFLSEEEATELMSVLYKQTKWSAKDNIIRGRKVPQPRLVAWYGPFPYAYSGAILEASEMPLIIQGLKDRIENFLMKLNISIKLNSVLLNLYRDGKDSVAWHSDDELTMGIQPTIASISLGEVRKFEMRRKASITENEMLTDPETLYLNLRHGSLLIMDGAMQKDWEHRVPKEYHDKSARINLTFRTVYPLNQMLTNVPCLTSMVVKDSFKSLALEDESFTVKMKDESAFDAQNFPPLGNSTNHSFSNMSNKNVSVHTSDDSSRYKNMEDNICMKNDNYSQRKFSEMGKLLCSEANKTKIAKEECLWKEKEEMRFNNETVSSLNLNTSNDPLNVAVEDGKCFYSPESNRKVVLELQNEMTENRSWVPNIEAPAFIPSFSSEVLQSEVQ